MTVIAPLYTLLCVSSDEEPASLAVLSDRGEEVVGKIIDHVHEYDQMIAHVIDLLAAKYNNMATSSIETSDNSLLCVESGPVCSNRPVLWTQTRPSVAKLEHLLSCLKW